MVAIVAFVTGVGFFLTGLALQPLDARITSAALRAAGHAHDQEHAE